MIDPIAKFLKAYFLRAGIRDGSAGFVIAVMAAFSVFLKYAKLWELRHGTRGQT